MEELLTKRVRLIRPEFNPKLDGMPGTVVAVGVDPDTEGMVAVKLDKHYLTVAGAEVSAEMDARWGREPDARRVWVEPEEIQVTSC